MPMSRTVERTALDSPILLTMGEPAGIGPEIAVEAWRQLSGRIGARALKLVGDAGVLRTCGALPDDAVIATRAGAARLPGKPDPRPPPAVIEAIETAVRACLAGDAAAVVTAPINKAVLMQAGFGFPG